MTDRVDADKLRALADLTAEGVARRFHETYERLAPRFSYKTRPESARRLRDIIGDVDAPGRPE